MPRGPLPNAARRRQNQPTLPTRQLPARGRKGRPPNPPAWVELGESGSAWWKWAWRTPQATAWDEGARPVVARRASLEDDLAAVGQVESLDMSDLLDADSERAFKNVVRRLAGLVGGRLAILKEMRELDDRLGLTPKAMGQMRWSIQVDEVAEARQNRTAGRQLKAVDPGAVAGA